MGQHRRGRRVAIVAIIVSTLTLALGGGAVLANASLSSTYGAGRAVTDYLAAMSRGDVAYMLANANYPKGAGGPDDFSGPESVRSMMTLSDNRAIADVRVTGINELDSTTSRVTVAMTWARSKRSQTYTVRQDASRAHFLLYHSWRVDIPSSTISVNLPLQAGAVVVDGIYGSVGSTASVIQGFHAVSMEATVFYDSQTEFVDARDGGGVATFSEALSAQTLESATDAVRGAFGAAGWKCDPRSFDCPGRKYTPAAGTYAVLEMDGGNVAAYRSWIFTFTGDPTAGMKLVVEESEGVITATGTCQMQLLIDGNRKYRYHGHWSFTLTWGMNAFGWDGWARCDQLRG
jgi:hypothetical protein